MGRENDRKFRILIVDDVPKNIQVAANILQQEGYQMAFAQNGKTALAQVGANRFDLILLDIMMPEMDGFEVCEHLREDPASRDIPIIFLTARTESESIVRGFELGATDYVTKPFNGAELLARVRTHLELRRAHWKLQEANATKDKFFSIIAHDLKNPFNVFLGLSKLLLDSYESFDDEKRKAIIRSIFQASENGYKLLENLLEWSRVQTGRIKWRPDHIDLYTYAFENIAFLEASARNKSIVLRSDIPKGTPAYADPDMVTTVVRNLMANAIKFTDEGGHVIISSRTVGDHEEVTVSDTGIGIEGKDMEKLFRIDMHYSAFGTAGEQGTGLGLILCKEFVEKNRGAIWVESEIGTGSRFRFTLPKTGGEAVLSEE